MSKIFYRKKFSDYLGEQRAIDDIVTFYESDNVYYMASSYVNAIGCDGTNTSGLTFLTLTYNSITYPAIFAGGSIQFCNVGPLDYPVIGASYTFDLNIPGGYEVCDAPYNYDKIVTTLTSLVSSSPTTTQWSGTTNYYLNSVLVNTISGNQIYFNIGVDGGSCVSPSGNSGGFVFPSHTFRVRQIVSPTPTPTITPTSTITPTPSITSTQTPTPSVTPTNTSTTTPTVTPTSTNTPSVTPTITPTNTSSPTPTQTPTPSSSPLPQFKLQAENTDFIQTEGGDDINIEN